MAVNKNQVDNTMSGRMDAVASNRAVDLSGDSPELVAFALMRYLAQIEQAKTPKPAIDRTWLLDAYGECLEAVKGTRSVTPEAAPVRTPSRAGKRA